VLIESRADEKRAHQIDQPVKSDRDDAARGTRNDQKEEWKTAHLEIL